VRRLVLLAALALLAAGCSSSVPGEEVVSPTPNGKIVTQPTETIPPGFDNGDPTAGKQVFATAACGACHVLADAGAAGAVGPSLDERKAPVARVVDRVLNGKGAMPSFKGRLTTTQIADVAAYVHSVTSS